MAVNGTAYATPQERLEARLDDPRTADALERLLDKLDVVAFGVEAIDSFLRRSEEVADALSASIEELKTTGQAQSDAMNFAGSLPQLMRTGTQVAAATQGHGFQNLMESGLLDKLGDPKTIQNIETVLSKLEIAAFALTALDGFVKRGDEITNSISESLPDMRKLADSVDVEKLKVLPKLLDAAPALLNSGILEQLPALMKTLNTLANSGLLEPSVLKALGESAHLVSSSYAEAKRVPVRKLGIFALVKELQDPDVNRSITLLLETARQAGKKMG